MNELIIPPNSIHINCSNNYLPLIVLELLHSKDLIKIKLANNLQKFNKN
jgi:hypothetical protein